MLIFFIGRRRRHRRSGRAPSLPVWWGSSYGISEQTVWKWRNRASIHDRSHTAHRLQSMLTPAQEAAAVSLHNTLLLPLDDLPCVLRDFLNQGLAL